MTKPYQALFTMDFLDNDVCFEGITFGNRWNGWACPYFTYENAMKIAETIPSLHMWYDMDQDQFFTTDEENDPQQFPLKIIDDKKYYPIGNCSWCWYEFNRENENE